MIYKNYIKRIMDIMLSLIAVIILCPLYILLTIVVYINMGTPILYGQNRIGKNEKLFKLYKFRSMTNEHDAKGCLLEEKFRLTKLGIFLRSSSLDELPEFFSIIKGDMSLVGPRPLPDYYLPYYKNEERKRHQIRGGLIPPDILSYKNIPTWEEQFFYDNYYVDNCSLMLDIKIIFVTFRILLARYKYNYGAEFRLHLNQYRSDAKEKT